MHLHLQLHVRQFNPSTISEAARLAKLYESSIAANPTSLTTSTPFKPQNSTTHTRNFSSTNYKPEITSRIPILPSPEPQKFPHPKTLALPAAPFKPNPNNPNRPVHRFTVEEMQNRKTRGLCMYCDEPYTPEHGLKHRKSHIYYMEGEELDPSVPEIEELLSEKGFDEEGKGQVCQISVNAMNGTVAYNCMRVHGHYGKKQISILIDPGSSHNFLDFDTAKHLGCLLKPATPLMVQAALGSALLSEYKCPNFTWKLQGMEFSAEVRTVPLECFDLILGIQWLVTISPVWWDYVHMRMKFTMHGKPCSLRGASNSDCRVIKGSSLNKSCQPNAQLALLQVRDFNPQIDDGSLCHISAVAGGNRIEDAHRQNLLAAYDDIFQTPNQLPLFRDGFDHSIPYLPGESSSKLIDRSFIKREEVLNMLKFHLMRAQNRMKQLADSRRSFRAFEVGDWVYLKLQPYRQSSLKTRQPHKLSQKFYGPFRVTAKIGSVAYKLELPATASIHDTFHVSQLKLCPNPAGETVNLPQFMTDVGSSKEPEEILERKMAKRGNAVATKILVKWRDDPITTWEYYSDFISKFPDFDP